MKLSLKVGIFISDNTDLWLTDSGFGRLGRHNRKIFVQKIRETFPSEEYCGFKYATV